MAKPETMCTEVGCTREWTHVIEQSAPFTMMASQKSTIMEKKVCEPCAQAHERCSE